MRKCPEISLAYIHVEVNNAAGRRLQMFVMAQDSGFPFGFCCWRSVESETICSTETSGKDFFKYYFSTRMYANVQVISEGERRGAGRLSPLSGILSIPWGFAAIPFPSPP